MKLRETAEDRCASADQELKRIDSHIDLLYSTISSIMYAITGEEKKSLKSLLAKAELEARLAEEKQHLEHLEKEARRRMDEVTAKLKELEALKQVTESAGAKQGVGI
ncbi:unnamed protein product [Protopolystoma xenopodis]|uniref:Uncharacterized protein n=1 Tax=Protopolystoma xenopodis TaxID=117903 RepID=A0A448X1E1_9PLAT|nr:unnamed protein product [Protopolystoma xenopodis]